MPHGDGNENGTVNVNVNRERHSNHPLNVERNPDQQINPGGQLGENDIINQQNVTRPMRLNVPQVVRSAAELKEELEALEQEFAVLKAKSEFKNPREVSIENVNFKEKYQYRNNLVKKMAQTVSMSKSKIIRGGALQEAERRRIQDMVEEVKIAKDQIKQEDVDLTNWKGYTESVDGIDGVMDEILADTHITDSKFYTHVVDAINAYRADKTPENFKILQNEVNAYIKKRTKKGTKAEKDFREKGRRRIRRMKDLASKLNFIAGKEGFKVQLNDYSKIQFWGTVATTMADEMNQTVKDKLDEAVASEREFAPLKAIYTVAITEDMLEPDYVRGHLDEMKNYVRIISDAQSFLVTWDLDHANEQEGVVKTAEEIHKDKLLSIYRDTAEAAIKHYKNLIEYIQVFDSGDQEAINSAYEKLDKGRYAALDEKGKEYFKKGKRESLKRELSVARMRYIVGAYGTTANLNGADIDRLTSMIDGFELDEAGAFASEEDRKNFERELTMIDVIYNGTAEEMVEQIEDYMARVKNRDWDKSQLTKQYLEDHCIEMFFYENKNAMKENLIRLRQDAAALFNGRYGADYLRKLEAADNNVSINMSALLNSVVGMHGYKINDGKIITILEEDLKADLEEGYNTFLSNVKTALKGRRKQNS